ncbi:MAG TPA: fatty acid--CoA ligase [Deltaproteobacteria bacterium]|nr:fatty acid--CoA ligase [Deltaproteobacteria bacterium]HPL86364.1 fatty acid--CoA ligase [Deltaproteobacteria bacterium]
MNAQVHRTGETYRYQLNIKHLLLTARNTAPDQEIVYRDRVRYTYRDLITRINRLASALSSLGVKPGHTVSVLDYDSHRYLECYFAIPMMGAVLFTVNWRLSPEQIEYTVNHSEARVVIVHEDFLPLLDSVRDRLGNVEKVVLITEDQDRLQAASDIDGEYEDLLAKASPLYDFPDVPEDTKATTFYTTGTTGLPKGVMFTHRQLVLHTMSIGIMFGCHETPMRFSSIDVYMPITPMFHVHAWGFPYLATMMGVKQVYPGKYEPEMLLKLILGEKVTISHCVPTILQMLVESPVAKKVDLTSWKVIIGGARLSKGLARSALDLGIRIMAGYGMSETCPVISVANLKPHMLSWDNEKKSDVVIRTGLPIPLVQVEIADSQGRFLPHDGESTGEIVIRSPWATEGYFKDPERSQELWRDGWLHTGDVAHIDEQGYIQITDRLKDVIKTGGEWISSLDLENTMSMHEAVAEAAAIGVPDPKWGERPKMLVTLKPEFIGAGINEEVLRSFMKKCAMDGKIPRYGIPDSYEIVEAIPKTSVGKIDKKELRKRYLSDSSEHASK